VQGVFAAARDITDHKKMEVELRNSKELLEKLNLHLQEIRENERSQIALNLHDDLGQRLTALYLDVAWLKSRIGVQSLAIRKKMEEISQLINETIEGIKEFSSFLRPAILFDLGLVPAINEQLGKFKKQTGIICLFYCEPEEFIIDDRLALVLYRILQEALTNISRHAGASTTEINLRVLKNTIVMVIKDDGIGIDQDKINSLTSMGIAGIKERLKSVNGRVLIEGEKGVGTIMKVLIPLKKREES
jgi:signal transduction histidine kinase